MTVTFLPGSIFLAQPLLLDIRQRRFLVGIRFAVETLQIGQKRLWSSLERWGLEGCVSEQALGVSELFTDVWSIVDNARRLQRLLWKIPSLNESAIAQSFVERWPALKIMREAIQHPDLDFAKAEAKSNYIYGQLCWVDSRFRVSNGKIYAYAVPAGPQANNQVENVTFPADVPMDSGDGINPVIFEAAGTSINISDLLSDIAKTIAALDAELCENVKAAIASQKQAHPARAAKLDLLAKVNSGFRLEVSVDAQPTEVDQAG